MSAGRAVLWDLDGTLIDSDEFHWIAWRDTMVNEGIAITRKQFLSSFGQRNDPSCLNGWAPLPVLNELIELRMPRRNSTVSWFASMAFHLCQELNTGCVSFLTRDGYRPSLRQLRARM